MVISHAVAALTWTSVAPRIWSHTAATGRMSSVCHQRNTWVSSSNIVRRAVLMADGPVVMPQHLPLEKLGTVFNDAVAEGGAALSAVRAAPLGFGV